MTSTRVEDKTITAFGQNIQINQPALLTVTPGLASNETSSVVIAPTQVIADGQQSAMLTLTLKDALGNSIPAQEISVTSTGIDVQIELPQPALTDSTGKLVAHIKSTQVGEVVVSVQDITDQVLIGQPASIEFTVGPVDPANSSVQVSSGNLVADGVDSAIVTVTLKDGMGRALPGHEVQLSMSGTGNIVSGPTPSHTDVDGLIIFSVASTRTGQKTLTISDSTDNVTLNTKPQIVFIPGPVSASNSTVSFSPSSAPADGQTAITVTVTARDEHNNPIPDATVELSATGSAVVTQPTNPTNSMGRASGQITNTVVETVVISASINGVALPENKQVQVRFRGSDLAVTQSALAETNLGLSDERATAGQTITYTLSVKNQGLMMAGGVILTDTLPNGFEFNSQNSAFAFTQSGQALTWTIGDLAPGAETTIELLASIDSSVFGEVTNTLTATVDANSSLLEEDLANNTSQLVTIVESQLSAVAFVSSSAVLPVQPGATSSSVQIEVRNDGLGSAAMLEIALPAHLQDWVTVQPSAILGLAPKESVTVTLTAHPPAEQAYGVYQGWLEITDGLGGKDNLMVTAQVVPVQRGVEVNVHNQQGPLPGASLALVNDMPYVYVGLDGTASTYYPRHVGSTDANGKITFPNLNQGNYTWQLSAAYHTGASGSLSIVAGEGIQTVNLGLTANPGLHVTPGTLTLVASAGEQASQAVQVKNTGAAALDNISVETSGLPDWVQLMLPETLTHLDSQEQTEFRIFANPPADVNPQWVVGTVVVRGAGVSPISVNVSVNVLAAADAKRDVRFEIFDQDGLPISGGVQVIVKRVRPSQIIVDGESIPYQPQFSLRVDADGSALFTGNEQLEVGEEYAYQAWGDNYLANEGTFLVLPWDAPSEQQGSGLIKGKGLGMAMAANQAQVQRVVLQADHFVYTWTVTEIPDGINLIYNIEVTITTRDGTPASQPTWCTSASGCSWNNGTASWGSGGGGPSLPSTVSPPRTRYSQMRLSQSIVLAWQAFHANLWLKNTSALSLEQMNIQVKIADGQGVDRTGDFVITPPDEIAFDSIGPSSERSADWIILPKGTGITSPTKFKVYALIEYQLGGETYSYQTVPQWIDVHPAPSLDIHYEIPSSKILCQTFDIKAVITNNGAGVARNLRYNSLQPTTDDPTTSFLLISAKIGDEIQVDPMNLMLGDLAPGETRVVIWRIRASKPVYLASVTVDFTQSGGMAELIPAINSVTASMSPGACLFAAIPDESTYCSDPCGAHSAASGFAGDPVNTRTGGLFYPVDGLSVPTSAGMLSFRPVYISLVADKNMSRLGYGWMHNQHIRLIFPADPAGRDGYVLFQDHSGNMYPFLDNEDGTYFPYLGVLASLVKTGDAYTLTDNAKNIFIFDADGKLQSKTDSDGRVFAYSYVADGKLERVTAVGDGRYLQFAYNNDGKLESVADHTGRGISFAYDDDGNLVASTDLLGSAWTYEYDSGHLLTRVLDPSGKTVVRNEYSTAGRVSRQFDGDDNLMIELIPQPDGSVHIKDALGQIQVDNYNNLGTLVGREDVSQAGTSKTYYGNFRPAEITDALGNVTSLAWSDDGANLTSFTDAVGNQTTITYVDNKPKTITGPNGVPTTYEYNGNLLISVTTAGKTTTYTYYTLEPHQGLVETVRDPGGQVTKYEYDAHGQQTKIIANYDPERGENEAGLYNLTTEYEYDNLGRVTKISIPTGKADPAWLVTYNEYDDAGNLVLNIRNYNPNYSQNHQDLYNLTTRYYYDLRGSQIAVRDTYGLVTRTYYDDVGRVRSVVRNLSLGGQEIEAAIADETAPERGSVGPGMNLRSDYYYDAAGNLIATQDERGIIARTYDDRANRTVTSVQNLQGQDIYDPNIPTYDPLRPDENVTSRMISDANGNMIAVIDNAGVITRTYYDELNRPRRIVQNLVGQGIEVPWLADSACGQVDENLCTDTFYDISGNMIATKSPLGVISRTYYDALNRPVRVVQNLQGQGIQAAWLSDSACNQADANGNVSINLCSDTVYDDSGRVIASRDSQGRITRTYYDPAGRVASVVRNLAGYDIETNTPPARSFGAPDENIRTDTGYDASGRRVLTTDPLGRQAQYEYDLLGRLAKTTLNPWPQQGQNYQGPISGQFYNLVTTFTYDALGRTLTSTDTVGNTSLSQYDPQTGLLVSTTYSGLETYYHYDNFGRQVAITGPDGSITRNYFDGLGRAIYTAHNLSGWSIDNPNPPAAQASAEINLLTETVYGRNGQVSQTIATDGTLTEYGYDALGRQTSLKIPLRPASRSVYDGLGRLVASIQPSSAAGQDEVVTRFGYDAHGRLTDVWENHRPAYAPDGQTNVHTQYAYDASGNRLTIKDGNGHVTSFTYDGLGRLKTEADALGNTWTHAYDKNSNRVSMTDANGLTTAYAYDSLGRLVAIDYPEPDADVAFEYDILGRRTAMHDSLGTTTWAGYTNLNLPTSITDPFGNTVTYDYDEIGKRASLTYPGSGMTLSYGFDLAQRPNAVFKDQSPVADYVYDMLGRVQNVSLANGVSSQYVYDEAGQLESIVHQKAGQELASYHYEYYDDGNRKQAVELVSGGAVTGPTVQVTVVDTSGAPLAGKNIYAFNGSTYTNYSRVTDAQGQASITLPEGSYRFRVDVDGTQFWSGEENHCEIGKCGSVEFSIPQPVLVSVTDSSGAPQAGLKVYAFNGSTYTNFSATTDANGQVSLRLPAGNYRFRADLNGTQFWSSSTNDCAVPGCTMASVKVTVPVTVLVRDNLSTPKAGIKVYAFSGATYTNFSATTDEDGLAVFTLPEGSYRFRADFNSTQFWSGQQNHCDLPGCQEAEVVVSAPLFVTVMDTDGAPQAGVKVYAFNGTTYTNFSQTTDINGRATFTLPAGSYRFRADFGGTQFWSGPSTGSGQSPANHCDVPTCDGAAILVTKAISVTVADTDGAPKAGLKVYVFNGTTYTNFNATTNAEGQVNFILPQGNYRFRADFNGTQFWSGASNHCAIPGCDDAAVTVTKPLVVTVRDTDGTPKAGLKVYAFNGATYTNFNATTNASGQVTFTLPQGAYRFRADLNGTQFWSGASNHCALPGCENAEVTVSIPLVVNIQDSLGAPRAGVKVYAFNNTTYTNYNATSDASGNATFTLPLGNYRFRADFNGIQYWSGASNHCAIPGCASLSITVGPQMTATPTSTPTQTQTATPSAEPTQTATVEPAESPTPEPGVTPTPLSWQPSGPKVFAASIWQQTQTNQVTITVLDTNDAPKAGLKVYAFDGTTYVGLSGTTNADGQVTLTLPDGAYRFRADFNGTKFWSDTENHCLVPECPNVSITVTVPVTVTVLDTDASPKPGLKVYAFSGSTYTNYSATTGADGQAVFTLPQGEYRFRADFNGTQFWTAEANHCEVPGCESAEVIVSLPVTVTVLDNDGTPKAGLKVYAFDGATYTNYSATTNGDGQAIFTLPQGEYRFRADLNGTRFWSGETNHCAIPNCDSASVTVSKPVTVTVAGQGGQPYADLRVYAFTGSTYTGYSGATDASGNVTFTLPQGEYRFRADFDGVQFWSSPSTGSGQAPQNHCAIPGCETALVTLPGGMTEMSVTVDYEYDPLNRLTRATYSDPNNPGAGGRIYEYEYDAVGNRTKQVITLNGLSATTLYEYDAANRLTSAGGQTYAYDSNGNLLSDGVNTYTYDTANRLISVTSNQNSVTSYQYNGLGDRLTETVNGLTTTFTMDLNTGLTQALSDGTHEYIYAHTRLAQLDTGTLDTEYYLTDALGSVRQLADSDGAITLARTYDPYGVVAASTGPSASGYGFTGEYQSGDSVYLRSRFYTPSTGRFLTRDTWSGNANRPLSFNRWGYVEGNPVMYLDPSGNMPLPPGSFPPTFPLLTNPNRAKEIQAILYLLGDPGKAPGWKAFIENHKTRWAEAGNRVWWLQRIWECPTDEDLSRKQVSYYDKVEIVMAISMAKEWSGFINDSFSQPFWSEAVGRRYWENCSSYPCEISDNWTSTNAFLNYLTYDEAIQKPSMITETSLVFMTPSIRNTVLMMAARIRQQGLGRGGKDDDRPYGYFCTNCSGGKSADWLTDWLGKNVDKPGKFFGTASHTTDGFQQVVFAAGAGGTYTVILTPRQQKDLCGNQKCFEPNLPKPDWWKD